MVQELIKIGYEENIWNLNIVYVIQSGEFVKIGQTGNLISRLGHYKTHNPHPMQIVGLIKGGMQEENILHDKFKHLHVKHDWFQYKQEIRDYFSDFKVIDLDLLHDKVILQSAMTNPKCHAQTIRRLSKKIT